MEIRRVGSQLSNKGANEYFIGSVRIDPLFEAPDPARVHVASVTFEPGARTAWHVHPLGQTLIVTAGCGWVQSEGGPKLEIKPGDVVWIPPGEKHWHGATLTTAMTHIAIQEALDGKTVEWMEKVSDEQYSESTRRQATNTAAFSSGEMGGSTRNITLAKEGSGAPLRPEGRSPRAAKNCGWREDVDFRFWRLSDAVGADCRGCPGGPLNRVPAH